MRGVVLRLDWQTCIEKLIPAMLAAKVEGLPVALGAASGRFIDSHAANRVNCHNLSFLGRGLPPNDNRSSKTSRAQALAPFRARTSHVHCVHSLTEII